MIITKDSAKSLTPSDWGVRFADGAERPQQAAFWPLMITLFMIVAHILRDRVPKRCPSKEDHPTQAFLFYGTDKSFRERVQVWGSWRRSSNVDALPDEYVTKFFRVFRIAVEN